MGQILAQITLPQMIPAATQAVEGPAVAVAVVVVAHQTQTGSGMRPMMALEPEL